MSDNRLRDITAKFQQALAAYNRQDYEKALMLYDEVIALAPDELYEGYFNRALCYVALGRDTDAQADLRRAIELEPGYGEAHFALGTVLDHAGDPLAAISSYLEALLSGFDRAKTLNNLALTFQKSVQRIRTLRQGGQIEKASEEAKVLTDIIESSNLPNAVRRPLLRDAYLLLGEIGDAHGARKQAETWFDKVAEIAPFHPRLPTWYLQVVREREEAKSSGALSRYDEFNIIRESEVIEESDVTFEDVGGIDVVGSEYERMKQLFEEVYLFPELYHESAAEFAISTNRAVLLIGPTGVGKTYVTKAMVGEFQKHHQDQKLTFINTKLSAVFDKWVGNTEKNITMLIQIAIDHQPSLLFLDDIDALGKERSSGLQAWQSDAVVHLLSQLDSLRFEQRQVLVVGCTNKLPHVDLALRRRFDDIIVVPLPNAAVREKIFAVHVNKLSPRVREETIDFARLAAESHRFSPADIEKVVNDTKIRVWRESITAARSNAGQPVERRLGTNDLLQALRSRGPSVPLEQWLNETLEALRRWDDTLIVERVETLFREFRSGVAVSKEAAGLPAASSDKWNVERMRPPFRG